MEHSTSRIEIRRDDCGTRAGIQVPDSLLVKGIFAMLSAQDVFGEGDADVLEEGPEARIPAPSR